MVIIPFLGEKNVPHPYTPGVFPIFSSFPCSYLIYIFKNHLSAYTALPATHNRETARNRFAVFLRIFISGVYFAFFNAGS